MNSYISIIIPFYNRERFVKSVLDSIYSQGLDYNIFEVICIDDCSPTMDNYVALCEYKYAGEHPSNLWITRHEINKCQGGARNTGISLAKGDWIIHLDSDDFFIEGSLILLYNHLKANEDLDVLMYDYATDTCNYNLSERFPAQQKTDGLSLVKKYSIPWVSWCYAFKRSFLMEKGLKFAENVRVEDGDYVYRAVMNASLISFIPLSVVHYSIHDDSVSSMPNNIFRIEWIIMMGMRFKRITEDFIEVDREASMVCENIYKGIYRRQLSKCVKFLSYNDIVYLIKTYKIARELKSFYAIVDFFPRLFALFCIVLRPFCK